MDALKKLINENSDDYNPAPPAEEGEANMSVQEG